MTKSFPFFSYERNELVVDCRCVCGCAKSEHGPALHTVGGTTFQEPQAGPSKKSVCSRFTWDGWVTESEARAGPDTKRQAA